MKTWTGAAAGLAAATAWCAAAGAAAGEAADAEWAQWRGPLASGAAPDAQPPLEWSEGSNVRWKTPIPGVGHSSPVVWQNRLFLTTAVSTGKTADPDRLKAVESETPAFHRGSARLPREVLRFAVLAFDRRDGSALWERTVCEQAPHTATHADGSWASGSPATDGELVFAYFGSYGLYALDMAGRIVWEKQFGHLRMKANFGEGTSPVLCGELLILCQDQEGPSFIVALDKKTGSEIWRADRDEATAWSTPLVVEHGGRRQLVTSATTRMRGYDAASGTLLWEATGMTGNVIPCPVAAGGLVYCMSGFRGSALKAIRLDQASGDMADRTTAVAWSHDRDTPYVPSPLLYDGLLYFLKANAGTLTCLDAATGEAHYEGRQLDDIRMVYASPVGAAGRVYVTGRKGLTVVLKNGPDFEILARNKLEDSFSASAALAGNDLFLRGCTHLYCIAEHSR